MTERPTLEDIEAAIEAVGTEHVAKLDKKAIEIATERMKEVSMAETTTDDAEAADKIMEGWDRSDLSSLSQLIAQAIAKARMEGVEAGKERCAVICDERANDFTQENATHTAAQAARFCAMRIRKDLS